ncbi:DUF7144 family membrane protein [Streptomyces sp. HUAS TT20]|uniref:DUF7144 family membrane protein n=1 Tax=Streptomyces sp. HUAS TT20 TaxID=3447509 RepID=UPI0021D84775|nr:hypothetical protein [Streptomyces sp. HUAS 15-9]UXY25718.1 hypothetical protein N8I87_03455 [Streptomyces sp. HUAS 15-9]
MTTTPRTQTGTKQAWAAGLMMFAAVMLMITGVLGICRGIMAILKDDVFLVTPSYVFRYDMTGWGWIHLFLGAIAVVIGLGLFQATFWARMGGIAIAALIVIANFLSLPYYPVWSILMIAISGFIIWALCVAKTEEPA